MPHASKSPTQESKGAKSLHKYESRPVFLDRELPGPLIFGLISLHWALYPSAAAKSHSRPGTMRGNTCSFKQLAALGLIPVRLYGNPWKPASRKSDATMIAASHGTTQQVLFLTHTAVMSLSSCPTSGTTDTTCHSSCYKHVLDAVVRCQHLLSGYLHALKPCPVLQPRHLGICFHPRLQARILGDPRPMQCSHPQTRESQRLPHFIFR